MDYFSEKLGQLCEVCTSIFGVIQYGVASHVSRVEGRFWSPMQWTINVIGQRCHLCSLLLPEGEDAEKLISIIEGGDGEEPLKYLVTTNEGHAASVTEPKRFRLAIFIAGESSLGRVLFLVYLPTSDEFSISLDKTTWTIGMVNTTRTWLQNCTPQGHPKCFEAPYQTRTGEQRFLPNRLVDTGLLDENKPLVVPNMDIPSMDNLPSVRVCTTDVLPQTSKYITLSHCWGGRPSLALNNDTIKQYCKEIPKSDLMSPGAKTFMHAIWVTRCLGFRFIWIDALCIKQDDEDEKFQEISWMGSIYSNSMLNISATAAASGNDGLFYRRSLFRVMPCRKTMAAGQDPKR